MTQSMQILDACCLAGVRAPQGLGGAPKRREAVSTPGPDGAGEGAAVKGEGRPAEAMPHVGQGGQPCPVLLSSYPHLLLYLPTRNQRGRESSYGSRWRPAGQAQGGRGRGSRAANRECATYTLWTVNISLLTALYLYGP